MDRTLSILETGAVRGDGVMIPIATAVGNHDLGLEGFASRAQTYFKENYWSFY